MSMPIQKHFMPRQPSDSKGFMTLVSVLVVGAIGTAMAVGVLLSGVIHIRSSLTGQQSQRAKGMANACAEEALQRIWTLSTFTGSGNLTLGSGTCTYTVTNLGGTNREINAIGLAGSATRKVEVQITQVTPTITVSSWQEVSSF